MRATRSEWGLDPLRLWLTSLALLAAGMLVTQALWPVAWRGAGLHVDRLSALMTLLVSAIGLVCYRFALRYLDGEPAQRQFLRALSLAVSSAYLLMLAGNLLLLFAAWLLTSFGLHQLLTFYGQRAAAYPPARKKFLISRLGDLALLLAIGLIGWRWGTLDLPTLMTQFASGSSGLVQTAVALLVVLAALTKSAQFPFHTWLPETLEAPTPVSALMHAGIINAGGVLLLRFAPLLAATPLALLLLTLVGTLTAVLGTLTLWTQTDVKRTLAWSTVSQMGFMMVQCGLAVFPAAALHIVGHGCYKAWAFLSSGGLPSARLLPPAQAGWALPLTLVGTLAAGLALTIAAPLTGFAPLHAPGELALSAVLALALGQLWPALLGTERTARRLGWALGLTLLGAAGGCLAYAGAAAFLAPVFGTLPVRWDALTSATAALPVISFAILIILHAQLPLLGRSAAGRALYVHALHGFYIGALADRLVARVWAVAVGSAKR